MASTKVGNGLAYQAAVRWAEGSLLPQKMGCQGGPGEDPHQDWRSTGNGSIRPLALGLHAQVSPHLLKGDLQLQRSTNHSRICVGSADGSVQSKAWGVNSLCGSRTKTQRRGTGGLPERYQTAVCDVSSTVRVVPSYQAADTLIHDTAGKSGVSSARAAAGLSAEADRSGPSDGVALAHKGRRPGASGR